MKEKALAPGRLVVKPKSFKAKKEKQPRTEPKADADSSIPNDEGDNEERPTAGQEEHQVKEKKGKKKDLPAEKDADKGQQSAKKKDESKEDHGSKKRKADHLADPPSAPADGAHHEEEAPQQGKRQKTKQQQQAATASSNGNGAQQQQQQNQQQQQQQGPAKKRYLVFVGNLPYDTTDAELREHFKVIGQVAAVRLRDQKGFAFLEFDDPATHAKALKLHHSMLRERKINVEMTAGGGGNSENRKKRITEKNKKFQEEWAKKIAAEKEAQAAQKAAEGAGEEGGDDL